MEISILQVANLIIDHNTGREDVSHWECISNTDYVST